MLPKTYVMSNAEKHLLMCSTVLIPKILRYAPKDIRHVERRETSPDV
ncbi:hypothetical protein BN59_03494 [Legionella massiliensis]|uniref:Uncharacterized protein n=1 Tax=Legionella massiliensis TaxID=1034943 RepID=A0A078L1S4_9GAMM|nr:hypothetical protein BN59_03494 [Legionella massiliensis]CEE14914.1 hypothetical protein BN1094_03494 [Legionella massiliensis]